MIQDFQQMAREAERIYQSVLRKILETDHHGQFVAIEPESGDYYMGRTMSQAIGAARRAHPDRLAHCIRVGHESALHIGFGRK